MKKYIKNIIDKTGFVRQPINRNDRMGMLDRCWGYIFTNLIKGAYYEFGLYQGDSFVNSWNVYQRFAAWAMSQVQSDEKWRREAIGEFAQYRHAFYGFDSFEGIPDNDEKNLFFQKGSYACSFDRVEARCREEQMQFQLFKGFFSDISSEQLNDLQPAAIVNVDGDLYQSAVDVLRLIKPKLQQGTIVLMDDYNCYNADNNFGERRALQEFLQENPHIDFEPWFVYQYVGQAFLCHMKG